MKEHRPPHEPSTLPHRPVEELKTSRNDEEAKLPEQGGVWEDSMAREVQGLKEAGTMDAVV